MDEHATVPARRLTGGHRRLLELAMALELRPRMILLDDLLAGLTPTEDTRATAILAHPRRALARRRHQRPRAPSPRPRSQVITPPAPHAAPRWSSGTARRCDVLPSSDRETPHPRLAKPSRDGISVCIG
jgi:hypothetical protein